MVTKRKTEYEAPSFIAVPMATICSKSGCPVKPEKLNQQARFEGVQDAAAISVSFPQDLRIRTDGDFMYVFEPGCQLVFEMNASGGALLKVLMDGNDLRSAVKLLYRDINVKEDIAYSDAVGFLQALIETGFSARLT